MPTKSIHLVLFQSHGHQCPLYATHRKHDRITGRFVIERHQVEENINLKLVCWVSLLAIYFSNWKHYAADCMLPPKVASMIQLHLCEIETLNIKGEQISLIHNWIQRDGAHWNRKCLVCSHFSFFRSFSLFTVPHLCNGAGRPTRLPTNSGYSASVGNWMASCPVFEA